MTRLLLTLAGVALLTLPGCATSRYDELRGQSKDVERALIAEKQNAMRAPIAERDAKLSRLNRLWASLTAVDIALAGTRHAVREAERPVLYDAIEEAYDTISWNIPLPPGEPARPMPDAFQGGRFSPVSPPG